MAPGDARAGAASPRTSCWRSTIRDCADEFSREFLGWWEDPADSTDDLTGAEWAAAETEDGPTGDLVAAADVAPNGVWSSVVVCGAGILELVEHRRGTSWLPERLAELGDRHRIAEIGIDPAGPVGSLLPDLERAGVPVRLLDGRDTVRACGAMVTAVADAAVRHRGEAALMAAVGAASRRTVGDGWKWSRERTRPSTCRRWSRRRMRTGCGWAAPWPTTFWIRRGETEEAGCSTG